jgi:hypothetical protein
MNKQCPCCGFYTVDSDDEVIVDICPVCFWQYDIVMHNKPNMAGGANCISLNEARRNFKAFGVCDRRFADHVRAPLEEEMPGYHFEILKTG